MSTYGDQGYEQALEEIELEFGCSEDGDMLPPDIYRRNLISHIIDGNFYKGDGLFDKGIFDLEDIVLQGWAENRIPYDA